MAVEWWGWLLLCFFLAIVAEVVICAICQYRLRAQYQSVDQPQSSDPGGDQKPRTTEEDAELQLSTYRPSSEAVNITGTPGRAGGWSSPGRPMSPSTTQRKRSVTIVSADPDSDDEGPALPAPPLQEGVGQGPTVSSMLTNAGGRQAASASQSPAAAALPARRSPVPQARPAASSESQSFTPRYNDFTGDDIMDRL